MDKIEAARAIVGLQVAPEVLARVEKLADLSSEGRLSDAERSEYAAYIDVSEILSLLKLKARRILGNRDATS